jgi:predicted secreted hydrolase
MKKYLFVGLIIIGVVVAAVLWQQNQSVSAETPTSTLITALSEEADEGYARATEPNNIEFPRDLGAHDDYQTEWWYYTGNLETEDERQFGFQFTIFRRALAPPDGEQSTDNSQQSTDNEASNWQTDQIYFAHFTISDIENEEFYYSDLYSRGAAGLAGAQAEPYRVWVEDWVIEQDGDSITLNAATDDYALTLDLTQTLPPVLHGDGGLSPKSEEPGNASYYYSQVQQLADGTIQLGDETFEVTGKAWKDHEYSTSVLGEGATGWDWLSLQFDDGTALMLFEIRQQDGSVEPYSSGSFINADGTVQSLNVDDWKLVVDERWTSPASGATYPVAWSLDIPMVDLSIAGGALMDNQELNFANSVYWEGALQFDGTRDGQPTTAKGYMEMTGYDATSAD